MFFLSAIIFWDFLMLYHMRNDVLYKKKKKKKKIRENEYLR